MNIVVVEIRGRANTQDADKSTVDWDLPSNPADCKNLGIECPADWLALKLDWKLNLVGGRGTELNWVTQSYGPRGAGIGLDLALCLVGLVGSPAGPGAASYYMYCNTARSHDGSLQDRTAKTPDPYVQHVCRWCELFRRCGSNSRSAHLHFSHSSPSLSPHPHHTWRWQRRSLVEYDTVADATFFEWRVWHTLTRDPGDNAAETVE